MFVNPVYTSATDQQRCVEQGCQELGIDYRDYDSYDVDTFEKERYIIVIRLSDNKQSSKYYFQ